MTDERREFFSSFKEFAALTIAHYQVFALICVACSMAYLEGFFQVFHLNIEGILSFQDLVLRSAFLAICVFAVFMWCYLTFFFNPITFIGERMAAHVEFLKRKGIPFKDIRIPLDKVVKYDVPVLTFVFLVSAGVFIFATWLAWLLLGRVDSSPLGGMRQLFDETREQLRFLVGPLFSLIEHDAFRLFGILIIALVQVSAATGVIISASLGTVIFGHRVVIGVREANPILGYAYITTILLVAFFVFGALSGKDKLSQIRASAMKVAENECGRRGAEIWDGDKYRILVCSGAIYKQHGNDGLIFLSAIAEIEKPPQ